VKRIFASSYQAVSGTGAKAIEELRGNWRSSPRGAADPRGLPPPDRLQCHSARRFISIHGYTKEEMKMENEAGRSCITRLFAPA